MGLRKGKEGKHDQAMGYQNSSSESVLPCQVCDPFKPDPHCFTILTGTTGQQQQQQQKDEEAVSGYSSFLSLVSCCWNPPFHFPTRISISVERVLGPGA